MFIAELTVQRLHTMCPRGRGRRLWSGLLSLMLWLPTGLLGCAARRMNDHLRPLGIRLLTFRVSKCFVMQFIIAFIEFLLCHWQRNFVRWDDFDPRLSPFGRILLDWWEKRGFCLIIVLCYYWGCNSIEGVKWAERSWEYGYDSFGLRSGNNYSYQMFLLKCSCVGSSTVYILLFIDGQFIWD